MADPAPGPSEQPYHRGNLPEALLAATADAIAESGVSGLSLRDVARRAGVSHAAPAHHFGDKKGLLTAFATQGFEQFADALEAAADAPGSELDRFGAAGRAYVEFSVSHRAHFEVMWLPDLCDPSDPDLAKQRGRAAQALASGAAAVRAEGAAGDARDEDVMLAAWSMVHGLAWLILQGQTDFTGLGPGELADRVNRVLFSEGTK